MARRIQYQATLFDCRNMAIYGDKKTLIFTGTNKANVLFEAKVAAAQFNIGQPRIELWKFDTACGEETLIGEYEYYRGATFDNYAWFDMNGNYPERKGDY